MQRLIHHISTEELKGVQKEYVMDADASTLLSERGLDSLEYMILYMWLGELFEVKATSWEAFEVEGDVSASRLAAFVLSVAQTTPTLEEALSLYEGG